MHLSITRSQRLGAAIGISAAFFLTEISGRQTRFCDLCGLLTWGFAKPATVGFYTHSLALVADAFHYVRERQAMYGIANETS